MGSMCASSYSVVILVRMPLLRAARSMWCSVRCSVRHAVGLSNCKMGVAYVNRVRMSVLYRSNGMYLGMKVCEFMSWRILFVKSCVPLVIFLTCCWSVRCESIVAPRMVTLVDRGMV